MANEFGPGHYPNTGEVADRPTPITTGKDGDRWFKDCDPDGTGGTGINAMLLNFWLASKRQFTRTAGAVQSEGSEVMLAEAAARYASGGVWGADSGTADAKVVAALGSFVAPKTYFHGMLLFFVPAATNTGGAATINAFTNGSKAILAPTGSGNPAAGSLLAGTLTALWYDSAAASGVGAFRIAPWALPIAAAEVLSAYKNLPIFPEIEASGNVLACTSSTGEVVVSGSQNFLWRGWTRISTSSFSAGNRTFVTAPSKTYHLRWHAPGTSSAVPLSTYPNGRFVIGDLSDSGYNPGALAEYHSSFDSTYDDMLVAKVVTNGSNVPTVTSLVNKEDMWGEITGTARTTAGVETNHVYDFTIAWARTPKLMMREMVPPAVGYDSDYQIQVTYARREAIQIYSWSWHHAGAMQSPGFTYGLYC